MQLNLTDITPLNHCQSQVLTEHTQSRKFCNHSKLSKTSPLAKLYLRLHVRINCKTTTRNMSTCSKGYLQGKVKWFRSHVIGIIFKRCSLEWDIKITALTLSMYLYVDAENLIKTKDTIHAKINCLIFQKSPCSDVRFFNRALAVISKLYVIYYDPTKQEQQHCKIG